MLMHANFLIDRKELLCKKKKNLPNLVLFYVFYTETFRPDTEENYFIGLCGDGQTGVGY